MRPDITKPVRPINPPGLPEDGKQFTITRGKDHFALRVVEDGYVVATLLLSRDEMDAIVQYYNDEVKDKLPGNARP